MRLRLIRHATLWLEYGGLSILVDPIFSEAGRNPPIPKTANALRNPLVPLPVPAETLLNPDLVLITHLHRDHWDEEAARLLPKNVPVLCQPGDERAVTGQGFTHVAAIEKEAERQGIKVYRTGGKHGKGPIGLAMGKASGFVLRAAGEPSVYVAGDTIYCGEVEEALRVHKPDWTVVNGGGARFVTGCPITMTAADIVRVCRFAPETRVVAVHMEAINHCLETRTELRRSLADSGFADRVHIPEDGGWV